MSGLVDGNAPMLGSCVGWVGGWVEEGQTRPGQSMNEAAEQ